MIDGNGSEPNDELRVGKVSGGVSARLIALGAVAVLVTVIAIGVAGREPAATPASLGPGSSTTAVAQTSPTRTSEPPNLATPLPIPPIVMTPTAVPLYPQPPMPPVFMRWNPPDELYQVVAKSDGQAVKTFVVPGNEPTFEGALSLRGPRHSFIDLTLSAVGEPADKAVPTYVNSWHIHVADAAGLTRTPVEVLRIAIVPGSINADDPYLARSGYTLVVSARRLGDFMALYFFIAVTYPAGAPAA